MGDPAQLNGSPYGVNAHVAHDSVLESLADIGVEWMRVDVNWFEVEPAAGGQRWDVLDRVVGTAERLGISLLASIAYAPGWANGGRDHTVPATDSTVFQNFVRSVVERYRGRLAAVSIWNEPNLRQFFTGTLVEYLGRVLRPGLEAVREVDAEVVTCGPDLSSSPGSNPIGGWLKPILNEVGDLIDVIGHHQYDGHDTVAGRAEEIERLRSALQGAGQPIRPIWITEIGWYTQGGTTPEAQAALLRGVMREQAQRRDWWTKTFWYDSHGPGWGLVEPDSSPLRGHPRPAFHAYKEVIDAAEDPAPQEEPSQLHVEDARVIVEHLYRGLLGRDADTAGLSAYTGEVVRAGFGRVVMVARELHRSDEFRTRRAVLEPRLLALDLYRGILEREADRVGLEATVRAILAGAIAGRAADILASNEFQERFLGHH